MIRRIGLVILGLAGLTILAAVAAVFFVSRMDVRSRVESLASARLGRAVRVEALAIGWADPLKLGPITLDLTGLHLANPAWGSTPDMVAVRRLHAELALWPLLHGAIRLSDVAVERPVIVLERDPNGAGNWVFPALAVRPAGAPTPPVPLPDAVIAGMVLQDGDLTFRTSSGNLLRVHVAQANLAAANASAPIHLRAEGSYNDLKLTADTSLESFAALRRVPRPVATEAVVTAKGSVLRFKGTMTDPIGFDGIKGRIDLDAGSPEAFAEALGQPPLPGGKLVLRGMLEKQGDLWRATELDGAFGDTTVNGEIGMDEGKRGQPDHFDVNLDLGVLDLKRLTDGMTGNTQAAAGPKGFPLRVEKKPGETFKVRIGLKRADYGRYRLDAVGLEGSLEPARIVLGKLAFGMADGRVELSGTDEAVGDGGHLRLNAAVSQANAARVLAMAGADASMLTGRFDVRAALEMTGVTTDDALRSSQGQAVMSMRGGRMSRQFLQLASIDIRLLFRKGQGATPVSCFLGVLRERNGMATVSPLRLRTADGTIFGGGQVDLVRQTLDLHLQSKSDTTNFFALDLPVHIVGSFTNPKPGVTFRSGAREWDARSAEMLRLLPPELRQASADWRC